MNQIKKRFIKISKRSGRKPMKQASQLEYNFIDEYKNFLQNNGTCVVDYLLVCMGKHSIFQENILDVWSKNITNNIIWIGQKKMVFLQNV